MAPYSKNYIIEISLVRTVRWSYLEKSNGYCSQKIVKRFFNNALKIFANENKFFAQK